MLGFIATNRPFIVTFFLLAAAWSFFLTSPSTPGQPAPVLAEASPGGPSVDSTFLARNGEYVPRRKLHLVRRS